MNNKQFLGLIVGLVVFFSLISIVGAYHSSIEYDKNTWYHNGTVIQRVDSFWGDECLVLGDDNKRYVEYRCSRLILEEDRVVIQMQKDWVVSLKRIE